MKVLFARHGESAHNRDGIIQGWTNAVLSDAGREQARSLANKLSDAKIGMLVTSDLARAYQTASIVNEKLNQEILVDWRVRERFYGDLQGKPKTADPEKLRHNLVIEKPASNVEKPIDLNKRIRSFIDSMACMAERVNGDIVVISHGCYINAVRRYVDPNFVWDRIANCEVVTFDLNDLIAAKECA